MHRVGSHDLLRASKVPRGAISLRVQNGTAYDASVENRGARSYHEGRREISAVPGATIDGRPEDKA
jgi:hypothetical protein